MSLLHMALAFVVALGPLIVVHEFGHYLVARLCGVRVLRFSVGFGRALKTWRTAEGMEWVVAAVPLGGYVKMLDEREGPVAPADLPRAFNRQNVWRRIAIVTAGPVFNFIFAVAIYTALFMGGVPEARPVVDAPLASSAAAEAGLKAGDRVTAVDGEPIETWQALRWRVLQGALQGERLRLERIDSSHRVSETLLDLSRFAGTDAEADLLDRIGLRLYRPLLEPVLGSIVAGEPAQRAGLAEGDRITHAAGRRVDTWRQFVDAVEAHPGRPLPLVVERAGARLHIEVVPRAQDSGGRRVGRVGVTARPPRDAERIVFMMRYGPVDALGKAVAKTWDIAIFSLRMLGRMLLGDVSWKHLSGPITIADYAGQAMKLGLASTLSFMALISISLGVLNLLPIPLLDGGHLLYYLVEIVKGGPVSERVMEFGQRVGLTLLLVMMAFAIFNDLTRQLSG